MCEIWNLNTLREADTLVGYQLGQPSCWICWIWAILVGAPKIPTIAHGVYVGIPVQDFLCAVIFSLYSYCELQHLSMSPVFYTLPSSYCVPVLRSHQHYGYLFLGQVKGLSFMYDVKHSTRNWRGLTWPLNASDGVFDEVILCSAWNTSKGSTNVCLVSEWNDCGQ